MTFEEKMRSEGYTRRDFLCCPHCNEVLDKDTYSEYTEYHNTIMGICGKCDYTDEWYCFKKTVYIKKEEDV